MSKARGDPCRCRTCKKCPNITAEPKWFSCRPCATGNHSGQPCSSYEQASRFQGDACRCGFDRLDHVGAT